jgi:hypothetical protein
MSLYSDEEVCAAVDRWIDTWDLETLQVYAYENLLDYFYNAADEEELIQFMEESMEGAENG